MRPDLPGPGRWPASDSMQAIEEPELTPELISSRTDALMDRLRTAAEAAGRDPEGFRLVAVSKGFGINAIRAAVDAGLTTLGENRVQEAADKVAAFPALDWHLIGRLQSNKARAALRLFSTIHSVDSIELLRRLDRIAAEEGRRRSVLLQVNAGDDEAKAGFDPTWFTTQAGHAGELVKGITACSTVEVIGLMAMAPLGAPTGQQRKVFARLRRLRDALAQRTGNPLPELSMGMTADAEAAVAEGATMVRIGTAIFGSRPHH